MTVRTMIVRTVTVRTVLTTLTTHPPRLLYLLCRDAILCALYEQDTEVLGSRLKALQSEVELAEAELATHEETSTKARVLLPGVARDLASLALGLLEQHQVTEAAAIFTHAVSTLEGAFGTSQPELEAFKQEVKKAVTTAAEEGMARAGAGNRSERGLNC